MSRTEILSQTVLTQSVAIRSAMLLQIGAMVAIIITIIVGVERIESATANRDLLAYAISEVDDNLEVLNNAWVYDSSVIVSIEDEYRRDTLTDVSALLLVEGFFVGNIALVKEGKGADVAKLDQIATTLGNMTQRINRLRQALPVLRLAAAQGRRIQDMTLLQLDSYAEYLEFDEFFRGEGQEIWTQICKLAGIIQYVYSDNDGDTEGYVNQLVRSERGSKVLAWASEQLVRTSDEAGDFISGLEQFGTGDVGAKVFELLSMTGSADSFLTPRNAAFREAGYPFVEQDNATSEAVLVIASEIDRFEFDTIKSTMMEFIRRVDNVKNLEEDRAIALPFGSVVIPQKHSWFILIIGLVLFFHLVKLRYRMHGFMKQLEIYPEMWTTTMDVMPYRVVPRYDVSFWFWQLHHDILGLFGLAIACVAIWCFPDWLGISGWYWLIVAYLVAAMMTLAFWSRFQMNGEPHSLSKYSIWVISNSNY